ncbi:hypothetical protein ACFC6L_21290 [Kitasatospora phosalacinea]|uniref:hypothetical protein n=1 Tax=Kitasatospora phosalacinea TaxID=2065 RepID=UPI0035DB00F7
MSSLLAEIEHAQFDWDDFEGTGQRTRDLIRRIAADKAVLADLVDRSLDDPLLRAMAEHHEPLDSLVLHDAQDRGFRLHLHHWNGTRCDRPHDHRFPFSSVILTGGHRQRWHRIDTDLCAPESEGAAPGPTGPARSGAAEGAFEAIEQMLVRDEGPGHCYTLHDSVIHSTSTKPDTFSLFLRGPAVKPRSIVLDTDTRQVRWRGGAGQESAERRAESGLGDEALQSVRERLNRLVLT